MTVVTYAMSDDREVRLDVGERADAANGRDPDGHGQMFAICIVFVSVKLEIGLERIACSVLQI